MNSWSRFRLVSRWSSRRRDAIVEDILSGQDWTRNLLDRDGNSVWGFDRLARALISGEAAPRDLRGIEFRDIDLSSTLALSDADISIASFDRVVFVNSTITGSVIKGARFRGYCDLSGTTLRFCDLRGAIFLDANLSSCAFINCDLRGARFIGGSLVGASFKDVTYSRPRALPIGLGPTRFWVEGRLADVSAESDAGIRSFIASEARCQRMMKEKPGWALIWRVMADYGRSAPRLFLWVVSLWIFFGLWYSQFPVPEILVGSWAGEVLENLRPCIVDQSGARLDDPDFGRGLFLSAVSMLSLNVAAPQLDCSCLSARVPHVLEGALGLFLLATLTALLVEGLSVHHD